MEQNLAEKLVVRFLVPWPAMKVTLSKLGQWLPMSAALTHSGPGMT